MPYVVGIVLSVSVAVMARRVGFDRDRAFFSAVVIAVASYYVLFAVLSGSLQTVVAESIVACGFVVASIAGFKRSAWILVAALAGHGAFDFVHDALLTNSGVPVWWPAFCGTYDVGAAAGLAWIAKGDGISKNCPRIMTEGGMPNI